MHYQLLQFRLHESTSQNETAVTDKSVGRACLLASELSSCFGGFRRGMMPSSPGCCVYNMHYEVGGTQFHMMTGIADSSDRLALCE